MTKGMISIIIPCWNISKFLDDCFLSLQHQTYQNFEVIFVDDGSTDDTLKKLQDFCAEKENFHVISQKNQGPSAARNSGIANAQGEFAYFFDADDMLCPNILHVLLDGIDGFDVSMCRFRAVKENFAFDKIKQKKAKKFFSFSGTENILSHLYSNNPFYVCVWNKLYRVEKLRQMENFPNVFNPALAYGEDLDFNFSYMKNCQNANFTRAKLYQYRKRRGSEVRSKFNPNKMLSIFKSHETNIQICKAHFPQVEKYVRAFYCLSCVEMLFRIYFSNFQEKEVIAKLFEGMKANMSSLKKAKEVPKYKRWLIPMFAPMVLKALLKKRLRHNKTKEKV